MTHGIAIGSMLLIMQPMQASVSQEHTVEYHQYWAKKYQEKEQFKEAIEHVRVALAMQPDNVQIMMQLGTLLNMFCDTADECVTLYRSILGREPDCISALYNLAYTLKKRGDVDEALVLYDKVLQLQPDHVLAHYGRGVCNLMIGNLQDGWRGYEWRWKAAHNKSNIFSGPMWDGSNLAGKRILVHAEQGLGDTLQFSRYLKLLKEQGAYVIFAVQKPLKTLFSSCFAYADEVTTHAEASTYYDVHIPLMSLPLLCKTRVETIPKPIPYLQADSALIASWHAYFAHDTNFKVGLCWQGNANYKTSFLRQLVAAKSFHVNTFAPLAEVPGVNFYSLQKVFGQDQINTLADGFIVHTFDDTFDEVHGRFMDTAAVMKNLDLVISVDTGTSHLAGALGVEVWVPLPYAADWRWMMHTDDTPWYPTMRLFRQEHPGQWDTVMQRMTQELQQRVNMHRASRSS